jgi:hypothetical protein
MTNVTQNRPLSMHAYVVSWWAPAAPAARHLGMAEQG